MKKLIIIQTVAPDYRNLVFQRIKDVLSNNFELYAGKESFEKTIISNSKIHKPIKNIFLFNRRFLFQLKIWHLLFKNNVLVLEMNPRVLSNWIFLILRKLSNKETILWGHAWPRTGKGSKSDVVRNTMRKLGSKIIVYTKQQQKELQQKMPNKEILAAPNALFKSEDMCFNSSNEVNNLIYVGRLVVAKKVLFLVKAFHHSIDSIPSETKLIIVGDGDEKKILENYIVENKLQDRIRLLGHISDYNKLKELYNTAIFSVSPGYIGLSVTQSFGFGVPMLVSRNEQHSPEIEAVIENKNAIFFKTDTISDFKNQLVDIFKNRENWIAKRKEIVDFCKKNYSVEAMAETFIKLVKK
ncbi:MAG TPA: glycosyltransferase [Flavobacteriia bacterium]|nr:glycosyltransferase [Flavobacteriia bacterium]